MLFLTINTGEKMFLHKNVTAVNYIETAGSQGQHDQRAVELLDFQHLFGVRPP